MISLIAIAAVGCHPDSKTESRQQDGSDNTMKAQIDRIETWLNSNAPDLALLFNPPVTIDDITAFEQKHKLTFPPDLRQLYLIHNGEKQESDGIFGCWKLLPLAKVEEEIELMEHVGKIPFLLSKGGDSYYLKSFDEENPDLKIYECWHEQPDNETVTANSLIDFLNEFNEKLSNGQFVRDPDYENPLKALVDKDDL